MNYINQNQTECSLLALLDNLDFKVDMGQSQYILLLKKQPNKTYSTLYLSDCEANYYLRKIDVKYIEQLKSQLKLKTSTQTFIKCFMNGLKYNSTIDVSAENAKIQLKLAIGEGLTMNCVVKFTAKISIPAAENGYQIITKIFMRQLYESKQHSIKSLKQQVQSLKQKKQIQMNEQNAIKDKRFIDQIFNLNQEKKDPNKNLKNRDLLNPNKQRRKHAGVKLSTPN